MNQKTKQKNPVTLAGQVLLTVPVKRVKEN